MVAARRPLAGRRGRTWAIAGRGDAALQAAQVGRNVEAVLDAAGPTGTDVVRFDVDAVAGHDLRAAMGALRAARGRSATPPTVSVLSVARLAHPEVLLAVDAVPVLPASRRSPATLASSGPAGSGRIVDPGTADQPRGSVRKRAGSTPIRAHRSRNRRSRSCRSSVWNSRKYGRSVQSKGSRVLPWRNISIATK